MKRPFVTSLVAIALFGKTTSAQDSTAIQTAQKKADVSKYEAVNFAVPENPAFSFLGISPSKVSRPTSLHDLSADILNGVGRDGKVRQGFALDIAPYFYTGASVSLKDYQRPGGPGYSMANFHVNLATVRTQGDSGSTDVALGLRVAILDESDPMTSKVVTDAIAAGLLECPSITPSANQKQRDEYDACIKKKMQAIPLKQLLPTLWNARRLAIAVVSGLRLQNSEFGRSLGTGSELWLGYSDHSGANDQWIISIKGRANRGAVQDSSYQALSGGLRLNYGSDRGNAFGEVTAEQRFSQTAAVKKNATTWTAGVEFRAADGVWISTGVGSGYESAKKADRVVALLGLRWGVSSADRLSPK